MNNFCTACRTPVSPEPAVLDRIRRAAAEGGYPLPEETIFYRQVGCPSCGGRVALHEFIVFTPEVRQAFLMSASREEFTRALRAQGQCSFFAAQVQQAMAGKISLDTLLRYLPY